jgi:hypothetical protein
MDVGVRPRRAGAMNNTVISVCSVATVLQTIRDALLHRFSGVLYLSHD